MEDLRAWVNLVANTGGVGALALMLWWLLREQSMQFRAELQAQRSDHANAVQRMQDKRDEQHKEMLEMLARIERATRDRRRPKPGGQRP